MLSAVLYHDCLSINRLIKAVNMCAMPKTELVIHRIYEAIGLELILIGQ